MTTKRVQLIHWYTQHVYVCLSIETVLLQYTYTLGNVLKSVMHVYVVAASPFMGTLYITSSTASFMHIHVHVHSIYGPFMHHASCTHPD